jgi:hypothetical protein
MFAIIPSTIKCTLIVHLITRITMSSAHVNRPNVKYSYTEEEEKKNQYYFV